MWLPVGCTSRAVRNAGIRASYWEGNGAVVTREQRIVATFVEFSAALTGDFDVVEFLHRLARRCEDLLECEEAGLMLADPSGHLRVMASSSERSEALDLLQAQTHEGPCYECFLRGERVVSTDLVADSERWPAFAHTAVGLGFLSVQAVPMTVSGRTVGAVNLFSGVSGQPPAQDVDLAQGLADVAAIALLQERTVRQARTVIEQLQQALTSRVIIEQAKGVLAASAGIGVDRAFVVLREHARRTNGRLSDVARELVEGRLGVADLMRDRQR